MSANRGGIERARPGRPFPLGATWDGHGVNFAVYSENAFGAEVCLFDRADAPAPTRRIRLGERTEHVWHGYVDGIGPGQRYLLRMHGRYDPERGLRFNPAKLLIDPYAKAIEGGVRWDDRLFGYRAGSRDEDLHADRRSNAPFMPKCVVIDPSFDWGDDRPPRTEWNDTVIYEVHVKGFTALHPSLPANVRGTYLALACAPVIEHLRELGVTAIELLPIHHSISERRLVDLGLSNYWGYSTIGFFAPDSRFSSSGGTGGQVNEFRQMVKRMHAAGIEVILDVVYNHTAEGNHLGPTLCFRGIDNPTYYRLHSEDRRRYIDYTGCGNSLNVGHPATLRLIMDSLRYWVEEMHVDGFRFDLTTTLARGAHHMERFGNFLAAVFQDPVVSRVKLIAEPWDLGDGGYQLGGFLPGWSEWNARFRDCVRDYWRGADQTLAEFASRFTGSSDLFEAAGRPPRASINFITCHDGLTLRDLVSYNDKHNEANGEENRDGENHNRSWNCGVEGPTEDPGINSIRKKQMRNLLATLLLSQGVPMLLGGDELGRTQRGNNNAYCQDNEISWFDWRAADTELLRYVRGLITLRKEHPVFRRRSWFRGTAIRSKGLKDIGWFKPDGTEMSPEDWRVGFAKSLGVYLNGRGIPDLGADGRRITDDTFYLLFNAHYEPLDFSMPEPAWGRMWQLVLDTRSGEIGRDGARYPAGSSVRVDARSTMILRRIA